MTTNEIKETLELNVVFHKISMKVIIEKIENLINKMAIMCYETKFMSFSEGSLLSKGKK